MSTQNFKSERVSKTSSFIIDSNIDITFPLFGAYEEKKWAEGWEPVLIYPEKEIIEEGTVFTTEGYGGESEYLWIIVKFDPNSNLIQYLVSTENRFWTITINCSSLEDNSKTKATVTYTFTGLNEKGNELNQNHLERIYKENLNDWADAINGYFSNI